MDFKPEKKTLSVSDTFAAVTAQQNIGAEINLPDYCSDIKRILKCIIVPGITAVSVSGETVTAVGVADIKLIYVSEKDKIDCYETQKDISLSAKCKDLPSEAIISPRAKTNYVNCRATSQRRISVEGNIGVTFDITVKAVKDILLSCQGANVQLKKESSVYDELICQREKVFDMGETVQVPEDKGNVGKILRASCYAVLDSKKAVSDKLLVKGQLCTQVLYCVDSDESRVSLLKHSMPISQIIDLSGIDENSSCEVSLSVRCLSVQRKTDSSSKGSLIEIGAKVAAMCSCTQKKEIFTVDDCYSTSHEVKADYTIEEFVSQVHSINQQKTLKKTLEITSGDIAGVIDVWCSDVSCSMTGKGDSAKGDCSAVLSVLYIDSKGVPEYCEKNVDFSVETKLKESYEHLKCQMKCEIRDVECTLAGKDKLEVKIESGICAGVCACVSKRILKNLQITAEKEKKDMAALTIYFPAKGEKLWDIARRYSTTAEAIRLENSLEGDTAESENMMLIPAG